MVSSVASAIGMACWAFVATTMDDLVILIAFYTEAGLPAFLNTSGFQRHHIYVGQAIGFTLLIALSLVGFIGGIFLPIQYVGLLGFLPILKGCWSLRELRPCHSPGLQPQESTPAMPEPASSTLEHRPPRLCSKFADVNTVKVMTVTVINGGDNVSIYTPLFVPLGIGDLVICIATQYFLLAILVVSSDYFTRIPAVAKRIQLSAKFVVPFMQIALGVYLLFKTGATDVLASAVKRS